jgi:hypothetical protein
VQVVRVREQAEHRIAHEGHNFVDEMSDLLRDTGYVTMD